MERPKGEAQHVTMDLIVSSSFDMLSVMALGYMLGTVLMSNPLGQALVNTSLVFLKNTEHVWRPVYEVVLKPMAPLALYILDTTVKALVAFGYTTVVAVRKTVQFLNSTVQLAQAQGLSVMTAITNLSSSLKDIVVSLGTLFRASGYILVRVVNSASYVVDSFEQVGNFLYQTILQPSSLSWAGISNIAVPFLIVASILGLLVWRFTRRFATVPSVVTPKVVPRRSSRIARKRALLLCSDLSSRTLASQEAPLHPPANL